MARQDARGRSLRHDAAEDVKRWGHLSDWSGVSTSWAPPLARTQRSAIATTWFIPCGIAAVALVCLAGGADSLWHHWRADVPRLYRAPCGVVLIASALAQLWIARAVWRGPCASAWIAWPWRGLFWRCLFVGGLVCYVAALALGPNAYVRYLFRAALACWYTLLLMPLVVRQGAAPRWLHRIMSPAARRAGRWALALSATVVIGEVGLRLLHVASGRTWLADAANGGMKWPAGSEYHGRKINAHGYWDREFEPAPRPGRYRVAVLGGSETLSGTAQTNCLGQVEARLPGLEVYNFGLPRSGLAQYAAQLDQDVLAFHPDLVLVLVAAGQSVAAEPSEPGPFDWRSLKLCQAAAGALGVHSAVGLPTASQAALDFESYLRACGSRVAACRTPSDAAIEQRWIAIRALLADLARRCRRQGIEFALVVAPEEFQVNPIVCQALRRRLGYQAAQLDLELPQRRLARLAEELDLPLLDLLPYFRATEAGAYARDDGLWTDQGNQVAGEAIAGWLQTRFGATILAQTRRGQ